MAAAALVFIFGLALVLLPGPTQRAFAILYSVAPLSPAAASYAAFIGAVLGAVMAGWAVLLFFVLRGPFKRLEPGAWDMIAGSLAVWFVLDTTYSLLSGFWQNAALNAVMLAAFALPLAATYKRLHPTYRTGA
jgi:hypothetical protein